MEKQSFTTTIQQSGKKIFLRLPFDPNQVWGSKRNHYVNGVVNGIAVRSLIELLESAYVLPLGEAWRRDAGMEPGLKVVVEIGPEGPLSSNLSADIAQALLEEPQARDFFDSLPTFYRNNYARWISSAKRPETRAARIAAMVDLLKSGKRER